MTTFTINQQDLAVKVFENRAGSFTVAVFKAEDGRILAFDEFNTQFDAVKAAILFTTVSMAQDETFKTDAPSTISELLATFAKTSSAEI